MLPQLYPHQQELVGKLRQSFATGHKRPLVYAATSFGKSVIIGHIITEALRKGMKQKIVVFADKIVLVEQLIETIEGMFGIEIGVIQGIHPKYDLEAQVLICSPQTIGRRMASESLGRTYRNLNVGLVLSDESHVIYKSVVESLYNWDCKAIGFSASPFSKGLGKIYDDLVKAEPLSVLMERGDIAKYKAFTGNAPDFEGLKVGANGDIQKSESRYTDELIGDVFKHWHKHARDRISIGFAPTIAKAEAFAQLFSNNGIKSYVVHSKLNKEDNENLIKRFKSGEIQILWSVVKLTTGFDYTAVSCMIDCQPSFSKIRFLQKIGRVLRKHPGKKHAVILDHASNFARMGFVEDITIEELDKGEKKEINPDRPDGKEQKPIKCSECGYSMKEYKPMCPECGHIIEKKSHNVMPDNDISTLDGELVELKRKKKLNKITSKEDKIEFLGGLMTYAKMKGYKPGWAAVQYKECLSVWPNAIKKQAKPCDMNSEVKNWIQHINIKNSYRAA